MTQPIGRPPYRPAKATRRRVAIAAGAGMTHEEIALGLGISRETLEKHFEHELSIGAYTRRLEVLEAMHAAAVKGNTTAAREYLSRTPSAAAPPPMQQPQPEERLGKKEQADRDAVGAARGTTWEDDLSPRRSVQ